MRYYFHIHVANGESEIDDIGVEFPSEALAIKEARRLAWEIMSDAVAAGSNVKELVEVADESGRTIIRLDGQAGIEEGRPEPP